MESSSQKIIKIITNIMSMLKENGGVTSMWHYDFFKDILEKLNRPHDINKVVNNIMPIFGGMGTFNDLILHKNSIPLIKENDQLADLSDQLFLACKEVRGYSDEM